MKLSDDNIKKLEVLLRNALAIRSMGPEALPASSGIFLADMMYDFSEFPKGFVPVNLGMEYYALIPNELAMRALTLGHLEF